MLVAGMGNVLRGDDGFGVAVVRRLLECGELPDGVRVVDIGIGGVHLVQELMDGYDALVIVDAVERGSVPGTLHLLEAQVPDIAGWPDDRRADFLADMHYATPSKAMILAKALGVLPRRTYILGCQPAALDDLELGLTAPVELAVDETVREIGRIVEWLESSDCHPAPSEPQRCGSLGAG
jgi:hydrogenase maturation protease